MGRSDETDCFVYRLLESLTPQLDMRRETTEGVSETYAEQVLLMFGDAKSSCNAVAGTRKAPRSAAVAGEADLRKECRGN